MTLARDEMNAWAYADVRISIWLGSFPASSSLWTCVARALLLVAKTISRNEKEINFISVVHQATSPTGIPFNGRHVEHNLVMGYSNAFRYPWALHNFSIQDSSALISCQHSCSGILYLSMVLPACNFAVLPHHGLSKFLQLYRKIPHSNGADVRYHRRPLLRFLHSSASQFYAVYKLSTSLASSFSSLT